MKKLLIAFVLGFGIFAGFTHAAGEIKVNCKWNETNPELQKVCIEARTFQAAAKKWMHSYMKDFEINESKDYLDKLNKAKDEVSKKMEIFDSKVKPYGEIVETSIYELIKLEYDKALLDLENAKNELEKIKNSRFADINKRISKGRDKAERVFFTGFKIMVEISDDLNEKDEKKRTYSQLELEKMFMEAIDYFKQAEKLARKPVIHSGGILPGPNAEEDGESYLANKFLAKIINGALVILFSAGTLILIIGGTMFLISSGEEEMKTKAKDTIFWGIVGIVIAVMSYAIVKFVVGLDFGF